MFNTPILDVAIGLIFVFLIYSLLATSVKEAIASSFELRARMLKNGITESMLADTPTYNKLWSIGKGIVNFFSGILMIFYTPPKKEEDKKLGDHFYDHPLLKNYGASKVFPHPSYLPASNFSVILMDILKAEFEKKKSEIAQNKFDKLLGTQTVSMVQESLENSSDIVKIKEILDYYGNYYLNNPKGNPVNSIIDRDTWQILQMHLQNSGYILEEFIKKLETWFDDTMNRVSGWYKRQAQVILFLIGIFMAITFNVDTVEIATKLSQDKNMRDQVVNMAIANVDLYKNDLHTSDSIDTARRHIAEDELKKIREGYQKNADSLNSILALGWGDYGGRKDYSGKICYVLENFWKGKRLLGILITAFAICLGAPFWFDLLNKLIKLRGAGKKEGGDDASKNQLGGAAQPVTVNVNSQAGEGAVG